MLKKRRELFVERQERNRLRKARMAQIDNSGRYHHAKKDMTLILEKRGFRVYIDKDTDPELLDYVKHLSIGCINKLYDHFKDLFKKNMVKIPKNVPVLVTSFKKYKGNEKNSGIYDPNTKMIYINEHHVDNHTVWIHEYAHFISYLVPDRFVDYAIEEYKKMLSDYFEYYVQKKTKRKNLETRRHNNEMHREQMAKYLGLPSEYSSTNSDEFFAEMLENWDNIPTNKLTFKLKQTIRKILMRL
jgi:hypothetical protein